jgi:hypothetical protein
MITAIEENMVWIQELEGQKGQNDFHRKASPVHKVTVEEARIRF